jgi:hypothetical protein
MALIGNLLGSLSYTFDTCLPAGRDPVKKPKDFLKNLVI